MFKVFGFLTKREGIEMLLIDYYENKLGPLICDRTAFLAWMARSPDQANGPTFPRCDRERICHAK
jgi:hypothetical protein